MEAINILIIITIRSGVIYNWRILVLYFTAEGPMERITILIYFISVRHNFYS